MERAYFIFEQLRIRGIEAINDFVLEHESESFFLDFKQAASERHNSRTFHADDQKNLAKAISGFGNSEGGVVVWGVKCSNGPSGDVASETMPITNPQRFKAWLDGAVSRSTVPAHETVESIVIPSDEEGKGIVATLIPKSQSAPHQTIQKACEHRYYLRAGSDFSAVPHAVLAGMFGRRPQPNISLKYETKQNLTASPGLDLEIYLLNRGPGVAKELYLGITVRSLPGPECQLGHIFHEESAWRGDQVNKGRSRRELQRMEILGFVLHSEARVIPGHSRHPLALRLSLREPIRHDLVVDLVYGCEGAPPKTVTWRCSPDEIRQALTEGRLIEVLVNAATFPVEGGRLEAGAAR